MGAKHDDVREARASMASEADAGRRGGSKDRSKRSVVDEHGVEDTLGALAVRRMMHGEWLMRCRSDGTRTIRRCGLQVDERRIGVSNGKQRCNGGRKLTRSRFFVSSNARKLFWEKWTSTGRVVTSKCILLEGIHSVRIGPYSGGRKWMTLLYRSEGRFRSLNIGLKGERQVSYWSCYLSALIVISKILGNGSANTQNSDANRQLFASPSGLSGSTNVGVSSESLTAVLFELMEQESIPQSQWADCFLFVERMETSTSPLGSIKSSAEHKRLTQSLCRICTRWDQGEARTHLKTMLKCLHAVEASSAELTLHLLNLLALVWRQGRLSPRTHSTSIHYFGHFHRSVVDAGQLVASADDISLMCDGLQLFLPSRQPPDLLPEVPTALLVAVCNSLTVAHKQQCLPKNLPKVHIQIQIEGLQSSKSPALQKAAEECLRSMEKSDRAHHEGAVASCGLSTVSSSFANTEGCSLAGIGVAECSSENWRKQAPSERPKVRLHRTIAVRDIGTSKGLADTETNKEAQALSGGRNAHERERQSIYRVQGAKDLPQVRLPAVGSPVGCSDDGSSLYSDHISTQETSTPSNTPAHGVDSGRSTAPVQDGACHAKEHGRTRIRRVRAVASRALRDVEEQLCRAHSQNVGRDAPFARKVTPKPPMHEGKENDAALPPSMPPRAAPEEEELYASAEQKFRPSLQRGAVELQGALALCAAAAIFLGCRQQV